MESLIIFSSFSFSSRAPVKSGFVFPFPLSFIRVYDFTPTSWSLDRPAQKMTRSEKKRNDRGDGERVQFWRPCPIISIISGTLEGFKRQWSTRLRRWRRKFRRRLFSIINAPYSWLILIFKLSPLIGHYWHPIRIWKPSLYRYRLGRFEASSKLFVT